MNDLSTQEVSIQGLQGESIPAQAAFRVWPDGERRRRARTRTLKIVGSVFAISLLGLFVHILLIVILPTLAITVLGAFPLYLKFLGDEATVFYVEGRCPHCSREGKLKPYLETRLQEKLTVQCGDCGQTSSVHFDSIGSQK